MKNSSGSCSNECEWRRWLCFPIAPFISAKNQLKFYTPRCSVSVCYTHCSHTWIIHEVSKKADLSSTDAVRHCEPRKKNGNKNTASLFLASRTVKLEQTPKVESKADFFLCDDAWGVWPFAVGLIKSSRWPGVLTLAEFFFTDGKKYNDSCLLQSKAAVPSQRQVVIKQPSGLLRTHFVLLNIHRDCGRVFIRNGAWGNSHWCLAELHPLWGSLNYPHTYGAKAKSLSLSGCTLMWPEGGLESSPSPWVWLLSLPDGFDGGGNGVVWLLIHNHRGFRFYLLQSVLH